MQRLRLGGVRYLNARPLLHGLEDRSSLLLATPSRLAARFEAGELDAALLPSAAWLARPDWGRVPDLGIASEGPVESVSLLHRVERDRIRRVALDEGSITSATLLRLLAPEALPPGVVYETRAPTPHLLDEGFDAVLVIGDPALQARAWGLRSWDLGEAWTRATGLPFVWAVWAVRPGLDPEAVAPMLREAAAAGLRAIPEHAAAGARALGLDEPFCRRYLGEVIRYRLGEAEGRGLAEFAARLR
jgi:chorismate dehydratase